MKEVSADSPRQTRVVRVAGVDVTTLNSRAKQFRCAPHGSLVTASLKPWGWTKPHREKPCTCTDEELQPILDAIAAAESNGYAKAEKPKAATNGRGAMLPFAIAYARRGISVFPVHDIESDRQCSCGKLQCSSAGKHPRFSGWQESATTDEDRIRDWWHQFPNANVGVKCGIGSNLTVLDVDGDEGRETLRRLELENGELPETPIAITGSGGAHNYFAFEEGLQNAVKFAPGLDVRTEGGLVVGVGSYTQRRYEWEIAFPLSDTLKPARMPRWLVDLIRTATAPAVNGSRLTLPAQIPAGERNNWLYKLARSLKARGMSAAAIRLAVQSENSSRCSPPMPDDEVRQLVDHATTEPDQKGFAPPAVQNGHAPAPASLPQLPDFTKKKLEPLTWTQMRERRAARHREWVVDGKLARRETSLWSGKVEGGKTTTMRELTLCVLRGEPFLGCETIKGKVAYIMLDADGEDGTYDAFEAMGFTEEDGGNTYFLFETMLAQIDHGLEYLVAELSEFKPALVIVDPYPRLKMIEDFTSYTLTYLMATLSEIARMIDAHFALPGHIPRGRDDDADVATTGYGSVAVSGGVNARFVVTNRNGTHTIRSSKGKGAGFEPFAAEYVLHENPVTKRISLGEPWSWKDKARGQKDAVLHFIDSHDERCFDSRFLAQNLRIQRSVAGSAANMLYGEQKIKREGDGLAGHPYIYASLRYSGPLTIEEVKRT